MATRNHYHVIRSLVFGEEFTANVPTKAQAQQAAKNQALCEAHRYGIKPIGSLKAGWIVIPSDTFAVSYAVQRCSQDYCTAGGREDSPSLDPIPLP